MSITVSNIKKRVVGAKRAHDCFITLTGNYPNTALTARMAAATPPVAGTTVNPTLAELITPAMFGLSKIDRLEVPHVVSTGALDDSQYLLEVVCDLATGAAGAGTMRPIGLKVMTAVGTELAGNAAYSTGGAGTAVVKFPVVAHGYA